MLLAALEDDTVAKHSIYESRRALNLENSLLAPQVGFVLLASQLYPVMRTGGG